MEIPQIQIHDAKSRLDQKTCLFVAARRRFPPHLFPPPHAGGG
jgi:hypothetical protein